MVTSATVEGFVPQDIPTYTTPVQVTGHTVNNLTVAQSPEGRAIFGWSSGGVFYCAVRDDFEDVYRDDVIPDGDERVVLDETSWGKTALLGSLWVDPREGLFCAIKWTQGDTGTSECYKANDAENPTSWESRGVISTRTSPGAVIDIMSGGPVTILDTGRWVLPFAGWTNYASGHADASCLFISDDRGVDWVQVVGHRESPGSGGTTGPISNTVGQDPLTGYLYWSFYRGPGANAGSIYESQDDGSSWVQVQSDAVRTWQISIDDGIGNVYVVAPTGSFGTGEWEWYSASDPGDSSTYVALGLTTIASLQVDGQFQAIAFQQHGSIALIDKNRIAKAVFATPGCPDPDLLHIPFKDRLLHLQLDDEEDRPVPQSFRLMADHDFDNLKEIERWAARWVTVLADDSSSGCRLHIPFKDHLHIARDGILTRATQRIIAGQSFENYKVIERWAARIVSGECACGAPERCRLQIPFKNAIVQIVVNEDDTIDRASILRAASQDFENYKTIERWANDYARGLCSTGRQPWPPRFPPDVISPARFTGEMMEVATVDSANTRFTGEMMEVAVQDNTSARLQGQMIEVAVVV